MVGKSSVLVERNDAKFALVRSKNAADSKCSFRIPFFVATICINSAFFEYLSTILDGKIVEEIFVRSISELLNQQYHQYYAFVVV